MPKMKTSEELKEMRAKVISALWGLTAAAGQSGAGEMADASKRAIDVLEGKGNPTQG